MPVMTSPWKEPQHGTYYFRRAIPKDLQEYFGRSVIKISLGTKDPAEAKRLIVPHIAKSDEDFRLARLRQDKDKSLELNAKDAAIIAARWYERMKGEIDAKAGDVGIIEKIILDDGRVDFEFSSYYLRVSGSEIYSASTSDLDRLAEDIGSFIDAQLRLEAMHIAPKTESYRMLAKEFYPLWYKLEKLCRARMLGDWLYKAPDSIAEESLSTDTADSTRIKLLSEAPGPGLCKASGPRLSKLVADYRSSEVAKLNGDLARLKTIDGYCSYFNRFIEVIGDIRIDELKRQDIMKFRDMLLQMPKSKKADIRSMSVEQQVAFAKANGIELLSVATVNNAVTQVGAVLGYAVDAGLISTSPTQGLKKLKRERLTEASDSERGYSGQDLSAIFKHEIFHDKAAKKRHGWASYWVPIICRYTGARLNEIGQLRKDDIQKREGISFINIRRGDGRSVKTDSSLRHVPIHSHLIELGFLEFVERCKTDVLFPEVPLDKYGKASTALSKSWAEIVRAQGINPKAPAHEFRHTLKTEMRGLGVPDSVSDRLTGHAARGEGGRYGSVSLSRLKDTVDRIEPLGISKISCN